MRIAIIGAGFTGLSAAYHLSKKGHAVIVFEKDNNPGGLALGYKHKKWAWTLERHYHHWFTNDQEILGLAKEIGHKVITKTPKTSVYIKNNNYQLDSPFNVIKFPLLSFGQNIRMGLSLAVLRFNPFWKPLEKYNAVKILPLLMGLKAYKLIWEPLFINKFSRYSNNISLAWFWARIYKRTSSLSYPAGGFLNFAKALEENIKGKGGKFYFNTEIIELGSNGKPKIKYKKTDNNITLEEYDKIIVTTPLFIFLKIAKNLPESYKNKLLKLKSIGATNLIMRLKKPFFKDNTYWLSICDKNNPIMAIVEHTNFMDKKNYGNEHLLYLGNYKDRNEAFFSMNKADFLSLFDTYLKKINPNYQDDIIDYELFKDPFAQPIIPVNYSKLIPPTTTPLENVYLANIDQVYPWDRGTNYAVKLGKEISKLIINE